MYSCSVSVVNVHFMGGRWKMGPRLRRFITSKFMTLLGLRPCPMEKAFPGSKERDQRHKLKEALAGGESELGRNNGTNNNSNKWTGVFGAKFQQKTASKVAPAANDVSGGGGSAQKSVKDLIPDSHNLMKAVDDLMYLESEVNMEFLWQFFAIVVDRIFLLVHIMLSIVTVCVFVTMG